MNCVCLRIIISRGRKNNCAFNYLCEPIVAEVGRLKSLDVFSAGNYSQHISPRNKLSSNLSNGKVYEYVGNYFKCINLFKSHTDNATL